MEREQEKVRAGKRKSAYRPHPKLFYTSGFPRPIFEFFRTCFRVWHNSGIPKIGCLLRAIFFSHYKFRIIDKITCGTRYRPPEFRWCVSQNAPPVHRNTAVSLPASSSPASHFESPNFTPEGTNTSGTYILGFFHLLRIGNYCASQKNSPPRGWILVTRILQKSKHTYTLKQSMFTDTIYVIRLSDR